MGNRSKVRDCLCKLPKEEAVIAKQTSLESKKDAAKEWLSQEEEAVIAK